MHRGPNGERRVGDAPGDDDVRTLGERLRDRPRTEIPGISKCGKGKARPMRRKFSTQHRVIELATIGSMVTA